MAESLNPKKFNLPARTQLVQISDSEIAIVKRIKSRIIKKDAEKIVQYALAINEIQPQVAVSLICCDNICSKSLALLADNGIQARISE